MLPRQETMNYWKQLNHVMKFFRLEEDPKSHLPKNFITGFLEVRRYSSSLRGTSTELTQQKGRN